MTTISRWITGVDPKLSNLMSLENAGLNIGWLVSGMGSMFSHNFVGNNLRNNPTIIKKIIDEFEINTSDYLGMNDYTKIVKKVSKMKNPKKQLDIYFTEVKLWFNKINEKSKYLFINYLFIIVKAKIDIEQKGNFLLANSEEDKEQMDIKQYLQPLLPAIIAFADDYLGEDAKELIIHKFSWLNEFILPFYSEQEHKLIPEGYNQDDIQTDIKTESFNSKS